jgi:hypothetical protein
MRISKASILIRGPFYPEDHPLFGVADDWFGTLVEIKPDNTFTSPDFIPEAPGGRMEIWHGMIEGVCNDGQKAAFLPFGSTELPLAGGQPLNDVTFSANIFCGDPFSGF